MDRLARTEQGIVARGHEDEPMERAAEDFAQQELPQQRAVVSERAGEDLWERLYNEFYLYFAERDRQMRSAAARRGWETRRRVATPRHREQQSAPAVSDGERGS